VRTSERLDLFDCRSRDELLLALRHQFAYKRATDFFDKGSRILDMGCGTGYGTNMLAKAGLKVVGYDTNRDVISEASERYPGIVFGHQIPLPYDAEHFDAVVCFQVLEHVENPITFLTNLRVMAKTLILTTPNREYRLQPGQKPWNRFHVTEYDAEGLRQLLRSCGFSWVDVRGITATPEIVEREYRRVAWGRRNNWLTKLRSRVPDSWKALPGEPYFNTGYSVNDYRTSVYPDDHWLDLLAVAKCQ
jgi:SAM-dependent methyltransferase